MDSPTANLIFLDRMEKNQTTIIEILRGLIDKLLAANESAAAGFYEKATTAFTAYIEALPKPVERDDDDAEETTPAPVIPDTTLQLLNESVAALHNAHTTGANRMESAIRSALAPVIQGDADKKVLLREILAELRKPRDFNMEIDRNYTTKLIQGVTIKQAN